MSFYILSKVQDSAVSVQCAPHMYKDTTIFFSTLLSRNSDSGYTNDYPTKGDKREEINPLTDEKTKSKTCVWKYK